MSWSASCDNSNVVWWLGATTLFRFSCIASDMSSWFVLDMSEWPFRLAEANSPPLVSVVSSLITFNALRFTILAIFLKTCEGKQEKIIIIVGFVNETKLKKKDYLKIKLLFGCVHIRARYSCRVCRMQARIHMYKCIQKRARVKQKQLFMIQN